MSKEFVAANRRIEALWHAGTISFAEFDWWLRTMCGV